MSGVQICVPPTVIDELAWGVQDWNGPKQELAVTALINLKATWSFQPFDFIPAGHGIAEVNAAKFTAAGIVPPEEWNDALILAEAGLLDCTVLITSDKHLSQADPTAMSAMCRDNHISCVLVKSPRALVKMFGGTLRRTT